MSHDVAWNGAHALVAAAASEARTGAAMPDALTARTSHGDPITIETATPARLDALHEDWESLTTRADAANIFMHPSLLRLAGDFYTARRGLTLLAWQNAGVAPPRLVGIWGFAIGRAPQSILPVAVLTAPPMPNAYLSTPVVDRDCLDAVLEAMLTHIAADRSLPQIIALDAMGTGTATMQALSRVIAARGCAPCLFGQCQRPMLASKLDGKSYLEKALSSSSRKKLRQHRRRLAEKDALQSIVVTETEAVQRAFEDFLTLEAAGWKGRQGTALLSDSAAVQFVRAMIATLAARGEVSIHTLTVDGRPASMQIVLRAGAAAFTWKTAYDEALHDFSPGMLLLEDYTATLLADAGLDCVDSCAFDDSGYMAAWTERASIAQIWLDARRGGSPAFTIVSRLQLAYLALRTRAKTIYRNVKQRKAR